MPNTGICDVNIERRRQNFPGSSTGERSPPRPIRDFQKRMKSPLAARVAG
jgi:hypothetical protein